MSNSGLIRKNWISLLGIIIGLTGVILAIIFYSKSIGKREPTFFVDSDRTEIIRVHRLRDAPLKLTRTNGSEISGDVTSVKTYFWNNGKLSIKPEHIIKPIKIKLGDPQGEILDYKILQTSRDIVKPLIERCAEDSLRILSIRFNILEERDGFCLQIVYVGNPIADFYIGGYIEGGPDPIGSSELVSSRFWSVLTDEYKTLSTLIVVFVIILVLIKIYDFLMAKYKTSKFYRPISKRLVIIIGLGFLIYVLVLGPIMEAKKKAKLIRMDSVPAEILTHQIPVNTAVNGSSFSDK